jgi:hypothetical protein
MQPHSGHLRKRKDAVLEKAATQEKDVAEDVIDPDLTWATKTKIQTPTVIPHQKEKGKAEAKKANKDPDLVPLVTESRKIHAVIVAVIITLPEPAISVRMTKRMVRQNHHTSKQTSTLPLTRRP